MAILLLALTGSELCLPVELLWSLALTVKGLAQDVQFSMRCPGRPVLRLQASRRQLHWGVPLVPAIGFLSSSKAKTRLVAFAYEGGEAEMAAFGSSVSMAQALVTGEGS